MVDPGGDIERVLGEADQRGLTLEKILLTHAHVDHCAATAELAGARGLPVEAQREDRFWIEALPQAAAQFGFPPASSFEPDRWLEQGDRVTVGGQTLEVLHCPGHTPGHVVFFHPAERCAWVGDVLFAGSIGRTDFPRGNHEALIRSIRERLFRSVMTYGSCRGMGRCRLSARSAEPTLSLRTGCLQRIEENPMNGAQLLVAALESEGVTRIFGVPGEENLDVVEALRRSRIELVLTRHEQAAAFMAATHGRLTGEAGVCLATLGPGALNLTTGAAYAQLGAMPMVMITGQKGILSRKQARFQIVDIVSTMTPLTKMAQRIIGPATIPSMVREAFRVAHQERPGPVHLELPEDVAAEEARRCTARAATSDDPAGRSSGSARSGGGAHPRSTFSAGDVGRRRKPSAPGRCAVGFRQARADPVLQHPDGQGLGRRRVRTLHGHRGALRRATTSIRPSTVPTSSSRLAMIRSRSRRSSWDRAVPPCCMSGIYRQRSKRCISRMRSSSATSDRASRCSRTGWKANCRGLVRCCRCVSASWTRIGERATECRFPLTPQRIVHDVRQVMPEDGIVCLDNGMYKIWFARNYRTRIANTLLLDNALATMGAGLPSAMMAAMLHPERRVLAVCGDGGFMMSSQELETAVRLKLNLVVLILQDNAYGMIRWKQAADGFADFGMTFGNPDFVTYARAYGMKGAAWRAPMAWRRRSRLPSRRAECISSRYRWTTRKTCACWSRSWRASRVKSLRLRAARGWVLYIILRMEYSGWVIRNGAVL